MPDLKGKSVAEAKAATGTMNVRWTDLSGAPIAGGDAQRVCQQSPAAGNTGDRRFHCAEGRRQLLRMLTAGRSLCSRSLDGRAPHRPVQPNETDPDRWQERNSADLPSGRGEYPRPGTGGRCMRPLDHAYDMLGYGKQSSIVGATRFVLPPLSDQGEDAAAAVGNRTCVMVSAVRIPRPAQGWCRWAACSF